MNFDYGAGAALNHTSTGPDTPAKTEAYQSKINRDRATMNNLSSTNLRTGKSNLDLSNTKEFKLQELAMLSLSPILRSIHHWWLQRAERHYLICADVEQQRAREAQMNVAYYQKRAALARSARL
ncbi:hypothetical protein [Noviherbaspirillum sp. UKPF54]|uniref:hypothetical protein n=1 Tax=Noviherbaspirillum sp. UKPF54 TaxID=2601898 RepID=UPI0011B10239|nr:hypothetical protein [Noviherbaspirillum sp. UKPF54]QDZ27590.1 hypothetical protein FAY22_06250 [Noviherbaspirillum sp. UKPF54]